MKNKLLIIDRIKNAFETARQVSNMLASQKGKVFLFLVISVFASISEGASISLLMPILETMSKGSSLSNVPVLGNINAFFQQYEPDIRLQLIAGAMFAMIIARGTLLYLASYLASTIPLRVRFELMTTLYKDLMATQLYYLHGNDSGMFYNNIMSQPSRVSSVIGNFTSLTVNLLVISVYVLLMLLMSWQLTIISLSFMYTLSMLIRKFINPSIGMRGELVTKLSQQAHQMMFETLNGFKQIMLSSAQPMMLNKFTHIAQTEMNARFAQARLQQGIFPVLTIASGGLICGLIAMSSLDNNVEISTVIMFTFLLFRLLSPVSSINNISAGIQADIHAFSDIKKFQNEITDTHQPNGMIPFQKLQTGVVFEDVSFHYESASNPALSNVSFAIPKGAMVAIVGPSGAGKSTIINLLANFYEPTSGRILVDGVLLSDLDIGTWRKRIGLVSQDVVLFNDTIRNNISFPHSDASLEDIRNAANLAAMDTFIQNELPKGYETSAGDRGVRLSGGQQQRLSLARAVLNKPDLIILDEATSNLDSITELAIQAAIETLRKTTSILVIAHRLSTIRHADVIVVVNNGRVVATGPHNELLTTNDLYKTMIANQQLDLVDELSNDAKNTR